MNTVIKPKQSAVNGQLMSPAKSQAGVTLLLSSPAPAITPRRSSLAEPLTLQNSSKTNMVRSPQDDELRHSIHRLSPSASERNTFSDGSAERLTLHAYGQFGTPPSGSGISSHIIDANLQRPDSRLSQISQVGPMSQEMPPPARPALHRGQRKQQAFNNKPFAPPARQSNDTWLGQLMPGTQSSQTSRSEKRTRNTEVSLFPNDALINNNLYSEDNTDIRNFFGHGKERQRSDYEWWSSFTPINPQTQSSQGRGQHPFPDSQQEVTINGISRTSSAEPQPRSKRVRDQLLLSDDCGLSAEHAPWQSSSELMLSENVPREPRRSEAKCQCCSRTDSPVSTMLSTCTTTTVVDLSHATREASSRPITTASPLLLLRDLPQSAANGHR
jgi:hypothetical protein